jgi:hypothetical protein
MILHLERKTNWLENLGLLILGSRDEKLHFDPNAANGQLKMCRHNDKFSNRL